MTVRIKVGDSNLDYDKVIDFAARIYGPNYYDALHVQNLVIRNEPSIDFSNFIIATTVNNDIVGLVRIVARELVVDSARLKTGGISTVGVHPDYRGKGIASKMINMAIREMQIRAYDISCLHGRRAVDGFYLQFGYIGIGRYLDLEIESRNNIIDVCDFAFIPYEKKYLKECLKIYNETYNKLSGSLIRDEKNWTFHIHKIQHLKNYGNILLCVHKGKFIGYLVICQKKLVELCLHESFFPALIKKLEVLEVSTISIHPFHPFFVYCRTNFNTILKERCVFDGGYMGKIINLGSTLKKLGSVLAKRAMGQYVSKEYLFLLGYKIDLISGKVSQSSCKPDIIITRKQTVLQFLLGTNSLLDINCIHWNKKNKWVSSIFPQTCFHTSCLDEI